MGMQASLRQISPWLLEQLMAEQSLVEPFLLVGFHAEHEASPHQVRSNLKNNPFFMEMTQDMEKHDPRPSPQKCRQDHTGGKWAGAVPRQKLAGNP